MQLCENNLKRIAAADRGTLQVPAPAVLHLNEKILQFGTGVLLRGLPDYFVNKAILEGHYGGRILMVKSTSSGDTAAWEQQQNLFTHCIKGIEDGQLVEENVVNAAVSRVLTASSDWEEILKAAENPAMELVFSNTTEVGIALSQDSIHQSPPQSFPGKLLAFLYRRFKVFKGDPRKGMVIVPTELIPDNGTKLESIVTELAHQNKLEPAFIDWLEQYNYFCNSLVDRIVPGKMPADQEKETFQKLGYTDELMIMSEVYRLWAIETSAPEALKRLQFLTCDKGVVLCSDISRYKTLKVKLLNGPHTFSCGLAVLAGIPTVKEAMGNSHFLQYLTQLMHQEIAPTLVLERENGISLEEAHQFAWSVIDRFKNPHIDHRWMSITMNYSSKMVMRNTETIAQFFQKFNRIPEAMALGMAALIASFQPEQGLFIQDDRAAWFQEKWTQHQQQQTSLEQLVQEILKEESIWNLDQTCWTGWVSAVSRWLEALVHQGATAVLAEFAATHKEVPTLEKAL